MIEPEVVRQVRELTERGWGAKKIAQELGIARNTVRRYVRGGAEAEKQVRPGARKLDEDRRAEAKQLFVSVAERQRDGRSPRALPARRGRQRVYCAARRR